MVARKPRIVIIGAGMAGLSAASQLQRVSCGENLCFDLTVLEASQRIGGRICTTQFGGDQVELGATWIHGIDGSPIYEIARRIGALKGEIPWERQDGFPGKPVMRAEGGFSVDASIIEPAVCIYKKLMSEIRDKAASEERARHCAVLSGEKYERYGSMGDFLKDGLNAYLSQQASVTEIEKLILSNRRHDCIPIEDQQNPLAWTGSFGWNLRSLQHSIFSMHENMERIATAANSLFDLDLESEKEYKEYPGEHITIGKGYVSVLHELASCLSPGTIKFGKKVLRCFWNHSHVSSSAPVVLHCEDGSVVEADHVIVTVSLGVLKAGCVSSTPADFLLNSDKRRSICRSVHDLATRVPNEKRACQLFEPPLPAWKSEAISRLGFGVVDKLFLQMDPGAQDQLRSHVQLIYNRDSSNAESIPWWMRKTFSLSPVYKESNVLLAWFAGEEALELESLSDEEILTGVIKTLARFGLCQDTIEKDRLGGAIPHKGESSDSSSDSEESSEDGEIGRHLGNDALIVERLRGMFLGVLRSNWARNPLFHGSYTYVAVGSNGHDLEVMAEPLPRYEQEGDPLQLLFAGEATERHFYSTTHGAYLSGVREANRLLRHYGLSHVEPL